MHSFFSFSLMLATTLVLSSNAAIISINGATISAVTLAGRELLRKIVHSGTSRIAISPSRNNINNTLIISVKADQYYIVRKITIDR